jgi:hypothetical protein
MSIEEMNEFLISIGGLERIYREDRGPIVDARYFGVGKGWFPIIKSMIEELIEIGWDKRTTQVKEKFGGLRFYLETYPEGAAEIISKYEKMSYTLCETCGNPGELRKGSWLFTLCDEHHEEKEDENR